MWEQRYFSQSQNRTIDITKLIANKVIDELAGDPSEQVLISLGHRNLAMQTLFVEQGVLFHEILSMDHSIGGLCYLFKHTNHGLMITGDFLQAEVLKESRELQKKIAMYFDMTIDKKDLQYFRKEHELLKETAEIVDKNKKVMSWPFFLKKVVPVNSDFEDQNKAAAKLKKLSQQSVAHQMVAYLPLEQMQRYNYLTGVWDFHSKSLAAALEEIQNHLAEPGVQKVYFKCMHIEFRLYLWQKFKAHKKIVFEYIDLIMETTLAATFIKAVSGDQSSLVICFDDFPKVSFIRVQKN